MWTYADFSHAVCVIVLNVSCTSTGKLHGLHAGAFPGTALVILHRPVNILKVVSRVCTVLDDSQELILTQLQTTVPEFFFELPFHPGPHNFPLSFPLSIHVATCTSAAIYLFPTERDLPCVLCPTSMCSITDAHVKQGTCHHCGTGG